MSTGKGTAYITYLGKQLVTRVPIEELSFDDKLGLFCYLFYHLGMDGYLIENNQREVVTAIDKALANMEERTKT